MCKNIRIVYFANLIKNLIKFKKNIIIQVIIKYFDSLIKKRFF